MRPLVSNFCAHTIEHSRGHFSRLRSTFGQLGIESSQVCHPSIERIALFSKPIDKGLEQLLLSVPPTIAPSS